jgi:ribose-phosphate pyrophosphokinase
MNIVGDIEGKTAIVIDDIIDTAGTICLAATALKEGGAKKVYACCTHPVLSGPAIERLEKAPIEEVVVTDTIPVDPDRLSKLRILSVAPLIAQAIVRIHEQLSLSTLFEN